MGRFVVNGIAGLFLVFVCALACQQSSREPSSAASPAPVTPPTTLIAAVPAERSQAAAVADAIGGSPLLTRAAAEAMAAHSRRKGLAQDRIRESALAAADEGFKHLPARDLREVNALFTGLYGALTPAEARTVERGIASLRSRRRRDPSRFPDPAGDRSPAATRAGRPGSTERPRRIGGTAWPERRRRSWPRRPR
jgi:hypothetical protein